MTFTTSENSLLERDIDTIKKIFDKRGDSIRRDEMLCYIAIIRQLGRIATALEKQ